MTVLSPSAIREWNTQIVGSSAKKLINPDFKCFYKWLIANKISLDCSKTEIIFS